MASEVLLDPDELEEVDPEERGAESQFQALRPALAAAGQPAAAPVDNGGLDYDQLMQGAASAPGSPIDYDDIMDASGALAAPAAAQAAPAAPPTETAPGTSPPTGVVTVPGTDGQPVRVALSGLSPAKRAQYSALAKGGDAAVGGYGEQVASDQETTRKDVNDAAAIEALADQNAHAVQAQKQDLEYDIYRRQYQQQKVAEARAAKDQTVFDGVVLKREGDVQNLLREQGQMTFDPDRFMKNRSVGRSTMDVVAIALGGIGQALIPGSRNVALDMLNQSWAHDVQAQHEAYGRKGGEVAQAKDAYGRARQLGMDHQQSTLAARLASMQQTEAAIKVVGAKYRSQETQANADMAMAHINTERVKTLAELNKTFHGEAAQVVAMGQGQRAFEANRDDANWNRAFQMTQLGLGQEAAAAKAAAAKDESLDMRGWKGQAKTKEAYMEATKAAKTERVLVPKLKELVEFRKKQGNETWDRAEIAKAASTAAQVKVLLKDKFGLGVMSETDSQLLDNVANDPTKVAWTPAVVAQLEHLIEQVRDDTESQLDVYGFSRDRAYKGQQKFDEQPIAGAGEE